MERLLPLARSRPGLATLLALALAAAASPAVAGEQEECVLEASGGQACHEEQVDLAEEGLLDSLRTELLQVDLARTRASAASSSLAATSVVEDAGAVAEPGVAAAAAAAAGEEGAEPLAQVDPEGVAAELEARLQKALRESNESIATLDREVKRRDATIRQLMHERQQEETPTAASDATAVDCDAYGMFCDPRVNCASEPISAADRETWGGRLATADGHANLRSWCMAYPLYAASLQKCVLEGDPAGYAREMFASQKAAGLVEADAVYCFVSGHCNSTGVSPNTTLQDAEHVCDEMFGHDRWTSTGWQDFAAVLSRARHAIGKGGTSLTEWSDVVKLAKRESEISAMTACAMGNYHCDVVYCQQNYCNDAHYRGRFGNLSWAF